MESQYWIAHVDERQVQQVVSSALDRLQVESRHPSVRYDAERRLWVYRHRHRSARDFMAATATRSDHFKHLDQIYKR